MKWKKIRKAEKSVCLRVTKLILIIILIKCIFVSIVSIIISLYFVESLKEENENQINAKTNEYFSPYGKRLSMNRTSFLTEQYVKQAVGHILTEISLDFLALFGIFWENFWLVLMYAIIESAENVVICITAPITLYETILIIGIDSIVLISVYLYLILLSNRKYSVKSLKSLVYHSDSVTEGIGVTLKKF